MTPKIGSLQLMPIHATVIYQIHEFSESIDLSFYFGETLMWTSLVTWINGQRCESRSLSKTGPEPMTLRLSVLTSCLSCLTPLLGPIPCKTETLLILM